MRYRHLFWLLLCVWLGMVPTIAHADALSDARQAIKKGDLRAAQINLRNAVRSDPQNAEARYWLAKVDFDLGDPVAAETEARAARDRGFDPHQTMPVGLPIPYGGDIRPLVSRQSTGIPTRGIPHVNLGFP